MKKYIFILFWTLFVVFDSSAQIGIDCNTKELYESIQGVWRQTDGNGNASPNAEGNIPPAADESTFKSSYIK